ncbi:MAG: DJ-1/PfpI family protein [Oscillospiraceae bacterium]|nr:DJ-1/PfpI family protein [Oscillospiraceae bacterium]
MVHIILADGFEEAEALVPADLLRRAGEDVLLVGLEGTQVRGGQGITVNADTTFGEAHDSTPHMLVLPGGAGGVARMRAHNRLLEHIQRAWDAGVYIAAICAAPTILAKMGLLDRRKAVCYPGLEDEMDSAVIQKGEAVVVDGRIITSEAAGSVFPFALKLVEALKGAALAAQVKDAIHYRA